LFKVLQNIKWTITKTKGYRMSSASRANQMVNHPNYSKPA
jgi:hypothetical protein